MFEKIKGRFKVNGVSTPYFGISWDNVDTELEKIEILCELYIIRKILDGYTSSFNVDYEVFLEEKEDDHNKMNLGEYLFYEQNQNKLFAVFENMENKIYQSKYFIKLSKEDFYKWVGLFDFIRDLNANIQHDSEYADFEDLIELHNFIVKRKNDIEDIISKKR